MMPPRSIWTISAPCWTKKATRSQVPAPPSSFGPDLAFRHTFAEPGRYKVWFQFQAAGQVQTVAWVLEVTK